MCQKFGTFIGLFFLADFLNNENNYSYHNQIALMYPPKIIIFRLKYVVVEDFCIHKNDENVNKTALVKVDLS